MSRSQSHAESLAEKECIPCKGGVAALKGEALQPLASQVADWEVVEEHHLRRTWKFKDFVEALGFVNRVAELAEHENHHPLISFTWGRATVEIWTHKIDGLAEADFVLAAKIDRMEAERQ